MTMIDPPAPAQSLTRRRFVRDATLAAASLVVGKASAQGSLVSAPSAPDLSRRLSSFYVSMRDGTRLAVDLWMPEDVGARRIGTILQPTRYTRSFHRAKQSLDADPNFEVAELVNRAGMAYAIADGRGTGASFGTRGGELTAVEFDDFGQLIDWIAAQSFSNGRVGAIGMSYPGTLSDNLAKARRPALKAIAPLYSYFDVYRDLCMPGGLYSRTFMNRWGEMVGIADRVPAFLCHAASRKGESYSAFAAGLPLPKPVDGPDGMTWLHDALMEHARNVSFAGLVDDAKLLFRDDASGAFSWTTMSPAGDVAAIEESGVAYFVQASWLDAGSANGALRRLATLRNDQEVEIGAWSHGGRELCDTLLRTAAVERSAADRFGPAVAFLASHVGGDAPPPRKAGRLRYYVMGAGQWRVTSSWPPPQARMVRHFLGANSILRTTRPESVATVPIAIKVNHGTGATGRWGARPIPISFDRAAQTEGLTVFRTPPLDADLTLAGHVRCALSMKSDQRDGSVFAYLDAMSPDGELCYLTEGALRLVHRSPDEAAQTGEPVVFRAFTRAQARPVEPGKLLRLDFQLLPIAARIERGWRLQLSLADRDVDWFDRYDEGRLPAMSVLSAPVEGSWIDLPVLPG